MKHIYRVTRPAWADMERSETLLILVSTLVLAFYAAWGETIAKGLFHLFDSNLSEKSIHRAWPFIDAIIVTFGCLLLIRLYKKLRVGCYPSTFLYCFVLPEASNPNGRSQVVGYCRIKPDMEAGRIKVNGASYFWDNGLDIESRVGFTSNQVYGIIEEGETTCVIRFNIDEGDLHKRLYRHGVLQFRLINSGGAVDKKRDTYAGYLQSMHKDAETQDVGVKSRGYAEWWCKGWPGEDQIQNILRRESGALFATLNSLAATTPKPSLWRRNQGMESEKTNIWGHRIPSPQSVILDPILRPYIEGFLIRVLSLNGLGEEAIRNFIRRASSTAKTVVDDAVVAYERDLKFALMGQTVDSKRDEALTHRAEIISDEIKPYLKGDSLLDIGCGNGLIANLVKHRFKEILLLDVVQYVPMALNLPFEHYAEGEALPVANPYDTVLLLNVLHHASNPHELLKLAWGATRNTLIVIESVIGVHQVPPPAKYALADLPDGHQIAFAAFVDWFYNRVLHNNVPVPYNFTTPEQWESTFLRYGMPLRRVIHLGQDIDIGPEYHVLFVLEKSNMDGPAGIDPQLARPEF